MVMGAIPLFRDGDKNDAAWVKTTLGQINDVIRSINLNGVSAMKSKVSVKDGIAILTSEPEGQNLTSPFPLDFSGAVVDPSEIKK